MGYSLISIDPGPMTEARAIFFVVIGSLAIYGGFTSKQFYAIRSDRKVARWKGRLLFVVVGAVFLLVGIKYFFYDVFH
jgi:hypothetical protein